MQVPTTFQPIKSHLPEKEQLQCPRCESTNTKFCYYNNYNLSQPRHFCKNCRRYWTKGGALRNVPVGGGTRKNSKRLSNTKRSSSSSSAPTLTGQKPGLDSNPTDVYSSAMDVFPGNFSSLLVSSGQFGSLLAGLNPSGSELKMVEMGNFGENLNLGHDMNSGLEVQRATNSQQSYWVGSNGWPDLAIYTPGNYQ